MAGLQVSPGWRLLEEEIQKMITAYKTKAVSPQLVGQPYDHATVVGGHNALQSLLDLLQATKDRGDSARKKLEKVEEEQREDHAVEQKLRRI